MKKLFITLMLLTASVTAMASGRLTVQPMYDKNTKEFVMPQVGLSVYQKMGDKVAYNGWAGFGEPLLEVSKPNWISMKHSLEFYHKQFVVAPGFQVVWDTTGFENRHDLIFVKLGYQLW